MTVEELMEIESIKQLKGRYFRLLDTKQWSEWRDVFTEDFYAHVSGPHPDIEFHSREEMVDSNAAVLQDAVTTHHGHTPEIEITGPNTAKGVWAMYDHVDMPGQKFNGYGHYHEEYRKCEDGKWRIAKLRLTRLRVDMIASQTDSQ
jgi:hypothetical protein